MSKKIGLIGRKIGMTQIFEASGNIAGVTVVELGPNTVLQVKSAEGKDGYSALQLGYGAKREKSATKAEIGHAKKAGVGPQLVVRELRVDASVAAKYQVGASISLGDVFVLNELVDVIGTSKGRGFAGVMKRWNMSGFKRTHGAHEYKRHGGSIGTRLTPGMTFKGVRMPGHMGNAQVTVQNVRVVRLDAERNLVFLKGGVPGAPGSPVLLRKASKIG